MSVYGIHIEILKMSFVRSLRKPKVTNIALSQNIFVVVSDFCVNVMSNQNVFSDVLDAVSKRFRSEIPTRIALVITNGPKRLQNVCCFVSI